MAHEFSVLPSNLPVPHDDGAADHLPGKAVPALELPATTGGTLRVDQPPSGSGRLVLYAYSWTGEPGAEPLRADWDQIPGARGCTPEACGFRDHARELAALGAAVAGVSTQDTDYQAELAQRLSLGFPLLSDAALRLATALRLPTFEVAGQTLLRRLTLIVRDGRVERVWYPVFPPDRHAEQVLDWLRAAL
ncbi:MAG: peroxiredoxin [Pseudonocardiaceae bacterium]